MNLCTKCDGELKKGQEVNAEHTDLKFCSDECADKYEKEGFDS